MADTSKDHLFLKPGFFSEKASYDYPKPPPQTQPVPAQERGTHAATLREQLTGIRQDIAAAIKLQEDSKSILDKGLIVEFESFEGIGEAFEEKQFGGNSELLNIRYEDKRTFATVFIPDGALQKFEDKITAYSAHKQRSNGVSADNQPLIDSIANFHKATVKALWTDTVAMPQDNTIACWEVWLSARGDRQQQVEGFKSLAKTLGIDVSDSFIEFKERTVLLIRATKEQLEKSILLLNNIAELRKAKTTADFFSELKGNDQKDWQEDLAMRITVLPANENTPFVCILDTGVNGAHPLLKGSITDNDLFTINEAWGKDDRVGHGTGIAGLSLFGDLTAKLENTKLVEITHRLESSKIINRSEFIPNEKDRPLDLYAEYTEQAIYQAEIPHARRKRVFQLAITTIDSWDRGKPSSWSAALDKLAFGNNNIGRLFIVSAGNADVMLKNVKYPEFNMSESIRDPGQAWNVLTVGAFTEKDLLSAAESADHNEITAFHGQISPYTTTSFSWENEWPLKPDVVMEGGNTAKNKFGQAQADSLSLLSTNNKFTEKPFIPM
ncbi:S8 family peptidase [Treponema primitia]